MKPMLASRARARLVSVVVACSCGAFGCAEQDHSIGWQEIGGPDTGVGIDVIADTHVGIDMVADTGVGIDVMADTGVRIDVIADAPPADLPAGDAGRFTRVWRDDFDTLDLARWEVAEHTFEENYADFSVDNARAEGGLLKLSVRQKPAGSSGKPYSAAEVRTWAHSACGKFLVSARIAPGAGVVSTFFGFHDFFQNASSQDWNEIVIESSPTSRIDYVYTRENPSLPGGKDRVPAQRTVPFDATAGFHVYGFEWTPTEVRYLVDGAIEYSLPVAAVADLNRSKRMVMSAYPSTRLAPGRTFDPSVLPTEAWYDWIEVYRYNGPCPTGVDSGVDAGASDGAGQ
jgi:endo-1,3-1,4-beta-glycanase ExoK